MVRVEHTLPTAVVEGTVVLRRGFGRCGAVRRPGCLGDCCVEPMTCLATRYEGGVELLSRRPAPRSSDFGEDSALTSGLAECMPRRRGFGLLWAPLSTHALLLCRVVEPLDAHSMRWI